MLLPSAFSCDGGQHPDARPQRPKLPSFTSYQPQHSIQARPSPLSSSCRALQAVLGGPSSTQLPAAVLPREWQDPFKIPDQSTPAPVILLPPPRSSKKRRRSYFEQDAAPQEFSDTLMENCPQTPQPIRTPKRRRKIPLSIPMGLSADDFRALDTPPEEKADFNMPVMSPVNTYSDRDSAYGASPSLDDPDWTIDDDRMLVETVLEKLRLSKRDWNECARKLGKDKDSLGTRWSLLVGEGNVGLRRGGRISRTDLDISSW
ncbi:hypothetical protein EDD37DRAFT_223258 [Exophiala viscosa]|uniref:Myb-like domain-containing protein n=1 Tax=Exophiala viscosa TaxID=2486360 RepID=A0AAN6IGS5_9EURO|nr:hypothetical protein EDD36DRAFT_3183 [Exophiala viscosa]KAI1626634.1 hypothetical protein EDD37DRAFT_223258 [Exophiala viscosa]